MTLLFRPKLLARFVSSTGSPLGDAARNRARDGGLPSGVVFGGGALAGGLVSYFYFAQNPKGARDAPTIKKVP